MLFRIRVMVGFVFVVFSSWKAVIILRLLNLGVIVILGEERLYLIGFSVILIGKSFSSMKLLLGLLGVLVLL